MTYQVDEALNKNAVYIELRKIYCCKGAEFSRPTLEKAWKEIERLTAELLSIRDKVNAAVSA